MTKHETPRDSVINDNIIKVCNTVHELKGRCDRLESEIQWLRETVATLMMKMTMPLHTVAPMTMDTWNDIMRRGATCDDTVTVAATEDSITSRHMDQIEGFIEANKRKVKL